MKTLSAIFSLIAIIILVACQNTDPPFTPTAVPSTVTPRPATATPAPLPMLTATVAPSPTSAPPTPQSVGSIGRVEALNPLLDLNPALAKISPLLYPSLQPAAEIFTVSTDNLTLTATLRLTDITPIDVKASIETAILPELADVRTVETVGGNTVRVTFTEPNCTAVDALAQLPILPHAQVGADNPTGFAWNVVSQTLTLPAARTIHFFADEKAAQSALDAGEIDTIRRTPRLIFAPFNNLQPPFDDPAVRRALSLAVDRETLVSKFIGGEPAFFVPFNPDGARAALDAAGITDRDGDGWRELPGESQPWQVSIEVDVNREDLQPVAFWLAEYYREIGVQARANMVPFSAVVDDLLTHDYQVAVYEWRVDVSAVRARWHSTEIDAELGQNITGYNNPQVDALIDSLDSVPRCDAAARVEILRQINQLLADDRPADFLSIIK